MADNQTDVIVNAQVTGIDRLDGLEKSLGELNQCIEDQAREEDRLASIVEASKTRQKMAAQELLQAERVAAREAEIQSNKIAAGQREAAAAAQALDAAFRQLGVRPLQQVVEETHHLQAALAQIRASGITSTEQDQAIAAFQARLAALKAEAQGVPAASAAAGGAVRELGREAENMGGMVAGASRQIATLAGAMFGLQGISGVAKDVVSTGAAFETLEGRLTSLLGSSEKAKDAFAQIKDLARSTPFEVSSLTESYVKLTAFGLQPTVQQMQAIADTAATLGGGTESLQRVTLALGQAWTKSKLQGDEILQLAEAGVPVWDLLAKATGKNTAELEKMSAAGTLGRDTILKLIDALGQENMGASARLMQTFSGAVSNAKDALSEFYDMIAKAGVLEYLTGQINDLLAEFDRMKASGDLKDMATNIAQGSVKVAEGVKAAVEAVNALSGVIKVGVEMAIAWRVAGMSLIPMLSSVATEAGVAAGATAAMGTAAAGATLETRTLGAASAVAAEGVGLLAGAMRLLKGFALVGIVSEVVSLGAEFFRAKAAAEATDRAVKDATKPATVNGPATDFELVSTKAELARVKTEGLAAAFYQAADAGKSAGEALKDALSGAKIDSPEGVSDLLRGLDQIRGSARATGDEVRAGLVENLKGLSSKGLKDFATMADFAFGRGRISAEQLAFAIDVQLDAAMEKLGVSATTAADGFSSRFREPANTVGILTQQIDVLRSKGVDTDRVFVDLITKTLAQASGRREFEFLSQQVERFGAKAGLARNDVDGLLEAIRKKSDEARPGIQSIAEAFEKLGLKSRESLAQTEKSAKEAFDYIRTHGGTIAEQQAAWEKYAEAAKAAHRGIIPEVVKVQGELLGVGQAGQQAGTGIAQGMRTAGRAVDQVISRTEELIELQRQADNGASQREAGVIHGSGGHSMDSPIGSLPSGLTADQLRERGYTAGEIEDYLQNRSSAPGTVNRIVFASSSDNYARGIALGLSAEQAKVFAVALSDEITRANERARGKAAETSGIGFGASDYAGFMHEAEQNALAAARTITNPQSVAAATQSVSGNFYGSQTVRHVVEINLGGQVTPVAMAGDEAAQSLVSVLKRLNEARR